MPPWGTDWFVGCVVTTGAPAAGVGPAGFAPQRIAGGQCGVAVTPLTSFDDQRRGGPAPETDGGLLAVVDVSNCQIGRSPPGAETTTRSAVPARNVWAIGSIGIFTRVCRR